MCDPTSMRAAARNDRCFGTAITSRLITSSAVNSANGRHMVFMYPSLEACASFGFLHQRIPKQTRCRLLEGDSRADLGAIFASFLRVRRT
jgi:hypothetical protein